VVFICSDQIFWYAEECLETCRGFEKEGILSRSEGNASRMDVKLIIEKGPASHRTIRLRSAETIIGRQKGCDIRIPAAEISRRHCLLSLANGQLMVEDLNSVNGTYLNNVRIDTKQRVLSGDRLRVGPLTFSVVFDSPPVATDLADSPQPGKAPEPEPAFELVDDLPEKRRPVMRNDGNMVDPSFAPIEDESTAANGPVTFQEDESVIPLQEDDSTVDIDIDAEEPMHIPEGEDLRDFLKQMDR